MNCHPERTPPLRERGTWASDGAPRREAERLNAPRELPYSTTLTTGHRPLDTGENMNAKFLDLHAAADFLGPGAVEVNRYQTEITDIVRRRGIFGQRIKQVPATGHPSRFFEQTAINAPSAASGFVDPRNIV